MATHLVGVVHDVTEREQLEGLLDALREEKTRATFSRRLIEAQEQERRHIARELHDDINQRLALLNVEVDGARQKRPRTAEDLKRFLLDLNKNIAEVSSAVESIAHQLHSSQLEYLGIAAAMKNFCEDFATRQAVKVDFSCGNVPTQLPQQLSVCLYRVMQEALQNAAKHSLCKSFEVKLDSSANEVDLVISDRGIGFDRCDAIMDKSGLGLISMGERVRLVNGTLAIESQPKKGTIIHVRVPFKPEGAEVGLAG